MKYIIYLLVFSLPLLLGCGRVGLYIPESSLAEELNQEDTHSIISDGYLENHISTKQYYSNALSTNNAGSCVGRTSSVFTPVKPLSPGQRTSLQHRLMSVLIASLDNLNFNRRYHSTDATTGVINMTTSSYVTYCLRRIII